MDWNVHIRNWKLFWGEIFVSCLLSRDQSPFHSKEGARYVEMRNSLHLHTIRKKKLSGITIRTVAIIVFLLIRFILFNRLMKKTCIFIHLFLLILLTVCLHFTLFFTRLTIKIIISRQAQDLRKISRITRPWRYRNIFN